MKTLLSTRLLAAALLVTSATFVACSKGTEAGDTNVERGSNKDFGQDKMLPDNEGQPSTRAQPDTAGQVTGKELYDKSNDAVDRNHDGIAD